MVREFFSRCGVLTVLLLFTAVILMPQQVDASPTVTCNSPMNVVTGVGGTHNVSAVSDNNSDIEDFSTGALPAGITFGNINPPMATWADSRTATVTVATTVSPGTYWITISATDDD